MNKKWIAGIVVVVVVVAVVFAVWQTTKRPDYVAGDMVVSIDSNDPAAVASADYLAAAVQGTNINLIVIDPHKDPKLIPMTDQANMEVLGAILFYASDGDHAHEELIKEDGYFANAEEAQAFVQSLMSPQEQ